MPVETTAARAAVLEIERFEWAAPNRIEIAGYWTGLHGRRFMRPTLVLKGEGDPKRLLALLEHKPWAASDGDQWVAAFAWDGPVVKFEGAELNVGSGIDLDLPSPRMRPGKPRRFRQRVVARDASRDADPVAPRAEGIVSDPPSVPEEEPKLSRAEALKRAKEAATAAAHPKPAANAAKAAPRPDPDPTIAMDAAVADQPAAADPDVPAVTDAPEPGDAPGELESARADVERLRTERDGLRRERDQALEKLRRVRAEVEAERQARERAVADARAEEREAANRMLGQGAELRAAVERQREIAYLERDDAFSARDAAITARDKACDERDGALAEARQARRDRKEAFAQRDRAVKLR